MENSIYKIVEEKLKVEKKRIKEKRKLRETMIREELKLTEARMEKKLKMARLEEKEEIKQAEARIWTYIKMMNCRTSAENSMKLQFMNKISQPILTGEELQGEGNTSIEVSLVNNSTGNIVDVGPESSASVEIVVLKKDFDAFERDDWTVEEFNEKIVHEVQGKMPLLEGNVHVKLKRGRGVLRKVKFRHHVTKMKPRPEFRLGARIGDLSNRIFVKEAKTESFIVKNYRNKYSKKHEIPSLSDEVWRLHNIRKGGKVYQRLQSEEIDNIEGFLIRFLKDPEGLKNVVRLGLKKWEAIVKHARMCPRNRRYCYINSQQKTGIVFNILGEVLGLYSEGQYSSAINMSSENKADADELLSSAINQWEYVVYFDDENSVNQYFKSITSSIDDSNPPGSQYLGHCSTEETPNISNSSFQGVISNSHKISKYPCSQSQAASSDFLQSLYSIEDANSFGDYLHVVDPMDIRYDQPFSFPDQVTDSLICDTDSMTRPFCTNEHLQYFETETSNLESSTDLQSAIDALMPCSTIPIGKAKGNWNVLVSVLRWWFSMKKIIMAKEIAIKIYQDVS